MTTAGDGPMNPAGNGPMTTTGDGSTAMASGGSMPMAARDGPAGTAREDATTTAGDGRMGPRCGSSIRFGRRASQAGAGTGAGTIVATIVAIVAAGALGALAVPGAALAAEATVEQPRAFGHVLGDIVTQHVLLQHDGRSFEPKALPPPGRVGAWFERRAARVATDPDGRRWLRIDYQLVNAPQALRVVALPAWQLKGRQPGAELAVPEWYLSVAPLTPAEAFTRGALSDLRPDRPVPVVATTPIRRQVAGWAGAAALLLLAWLGWWAWRERRAARLPFACARRELAALDERSPEAWQALHRAFDRTAGHVVHAGTLDALFACAPHLQPLRQEIEAFYACSQARFFGGSEAPPGLSPRSLCARLRRLERRHERGGPRGGAQGRRAAWGHRPAAP